jgi:hypothetical protein
MALDLTKLSDKDLDALLNNDLGSMSDVGLSIISGEAPKLAPPRKTTAREDVQAAFGFDKPKASVESSGNLLRDMGLTARGMLSGAASLPAMLADAPVSLINLAAGRQVYKPQAEALGDFLSVLGMPKAQTPQERLITDAAAAVGGVAAPAALANRVTQAIAPEFATRTQELAKFFSENVPAQIAAATGGALGGGAARESDASPFMQMMASVAGAFTPSGASSLVPAAGRAVKEIVRPGTQAGREAIAGGVLRQLSREPESAIKSMADYQAPVGGYTPTAAQASRDFGLISAETPIRALDTTGKFAAQASQANQARLAILDRLAKDKSALEAAVLKRDDVTSPLREAAFANSTVSPETFQSAITLNVNKTIDDILASPKGKRQTVIDVLEDAKTDIQRATTPAELYEIRKDLRAAAQGLLDKSSRKGPTAGAFKAAKPELESVIRAVDDTIESAASGYKDYLKKYAQSSKGIERLEAAQEFKGKVLTTTPDPFASLDPSRAGDYMISQPAFTRAIRAAEKETNLSKTQLAVLTKVAQDLDAGVLQRAGKVPGSDTFKNLSTANVIGAFIGKQMFGEVPAAINKVAAPLNWLYNGTDDQIRELLVDAMLDPKLASRLMSRASVVSIEPLSKELQRKAIASGYGAAFGLTEK